MAGPEGSFQTSDRPGETRWIVLEEILGGSVQEKGGRTRARRVTRLIYFDIYLDIKLERHGFSTTPFGAH